MLMNVRTDKGGKNLIVHEYRQSQIIEAARKIITTRGIQKLTVGNIAKEVGFSGPALYRHVRNKQEVLKLVLNDIGNGLANIGSKSLKKTDSPLNNLREIFKLHLSYSEQRKGISFLVIDEVLRIEDRMLRNLANSIVKNYLIMIETILKSAIETKQVSSELDTWTASKLFFGMIQGSVTLWALHHSRFPLSERFEKMWNLYRKAISVSV